MSTATRTPPSIAVTGVDRDTRRRALAVGGAAIAALVVWAVAQPVADLTVRGSFGQDQQDVGPAMVAVMSLIVGLAGWGLLVLLERTNANARTVWTATATAVLIGSLAGPVGAGIGTATKVALVCIHLAVAAVLIPVLATTSASR